MAFAVATPVFEGPFDLLLHLILREQVDIYEVNLSRIVDAYLEEIERLQVIDLDVATEFLLIAATLVELKARRLLPGRDDVDLDDDLALWEERDLLLARLLECKTFKDVAGVFSKLADDADRSYPRTAGPDERFDGGVVSFAQVAQRMFGFLRLTACRKNLSPMRGAKCVRGTIILRRIHSLIPESGGLPRILDGGGTIFAGESVTMGGEPC